MLADELIALHRAPCEIVPFTERYPALPPAEGYAAARALHAERLASGWRPLGRKIGFTNRTIWPRYGVWEPNFAQVWDKTVIFAPEGRAALALKPFVQPRIEPEVVFKLRAALSPPADAAKVLSCVEWIAPG